MGTKAKALIGLLALLLMLATLSSVWQHYHPKVISKTEYLPTHEIKEVVKIKKVEVPVEKIVAYDKEKIVEKLNLPEWVRKDTDIQAIATAIVPPYEGNTNTVALLNIKTGEGQIIAKQEQIPFISFEGKNTFYLKPAISSRGDIPLTIGLQRQFVRVKSVYIGLFGEGTTRLDDGRLENSEVSCGVIITW